MKNYEFEVLQYFSRKLQGITLYKDYVDYVRVFPSKSSGYGRQYMQIFFDVKFVDAVKDWSVEDYDKMSFYFANNGDVSAVNFVSYLLSDKVENTEHGDYLKRLKSFYDLYNHMSILATDLLVHTVGFDKFSVSTLDDYPEFNLSHAYWQKHTFTRYNYEEFYGRRFKYDVYQLPQLLQRRVERGDLGTGRFVLSENELMRGIDKYVDYNDVRDIIIRHSIPCFFDYGDLSSDLLFDIRAMHAAILLEIEEPKEGTLDDEMIGLYQSIIAFFDKLKSTKTAVKKVGQYPLQIGDLVLWNEEVYHVEKLPASRYDFAFTVSPVNKTNKLPNKRIRWHITVGECVKIMPARDYKDGLEEKRWFSLNTLKRMLQSKSEVKLPPFYY